jgi:phosphatidylglycerol:prolipoprotein diacylglycerol transferase
MNTISFPGLGIENLEIKTEAFKIFGFSIYWYAIIITVGLVLAFIYALKVRERFGLSEDNIFDAVIIGVPAAIICARLYYVIFAMYEFDSFWDVFNIRRGGLAIYGGVIGAAIAGIIFSKVKKIHIGSMFDIAALGFLIGQSVGRWGNFVNAECFGSVTGVQWGMSINGASPVHPTFLYESLWNVVGFLALHFYSKHSKKRFKGEIALLYVIWYGIGRGMIEGLRTDSLMLGELRISQILGFLSALVAIGFYIFLKKKFLSKVDEEVDEVDEYEYEDEEDEDSIEEQDEEEILDQQEVFDEEMTEEKTEEEDKNEDEDGKNN